MDDPFDPFDVEWRPVSPRLATVRRALGCGALLLVTVLVAVGLGLLAGTTWAGLAVLVGVLAAALVWVLVGRNVASWAYAERADDLLLRKGLLVRRLTVVPYGRMQFVDVTADPVHRLAGLATVQLHTAAATTDAVIRGLVPAEAARLRDRLAARGEARAAGL
ncbi:hypothetical protein CLV35_1723 [Motilibacter peucedani]|uniref:YdbS-like PH domain-containing protein n=1 Tax=Motilibacter peucedani TaxID=598650 RepID=A0A420XPU0_9ACTN|nr:PH domain-containing protein [Motilibacter peucedani]RKS75264.1 hypothetical protein CLV35_1723 [Motilibacter peucedani]